MPGDVRGRRRDHAQLQHRDPPRHREAGELGRAVLNSIGSTPMSAEHAEGDRSDDQAAAGEGQRRKCSLVGRCPTSGRRTPGRARPAVPRPRRCRRSGRRRTRRARGPARPGPARSPRSGRRLRAARRRRAGTARPPRAPARGTPASAPRPRRGARWRRRTPAGAGRRRTARRPQPGATPGEAGASDPSRARTVGTSSSSAAPAIRRKTTEPGVQPGVEERLGERARGGERGRREQRDQDSGTGGPGGHRSPPVRSKSRYTGYSRSMTCQESM